MGLLLLPSSTVETKAAQAIQENFKPSDSKPRKVKALALRLLNQLNLDRLENEIRKCQLSVLRMSFTSKTHKPGCPFRAIVTEEGSWQKLVSTFLQRAFKGLVPPDPFALQSLLSLVKVLATDFLVPMPAFRLTLRTCFIQYPRTNF